MAVADNKKILLVLTGGTICSITDAAGINSLTDCPLLVLYEKNGGDIAKFHSVMPYGELIFSENLSIAHLNRLFEKIITELNKNIYCGVIIVHGTDTLEFTQSVCKLLPDIYQIPVPIEFAYAYSPYPNDEKLNAMWDGYERFVNAIANIERIYAQNPFVTKVKNRYIPLSDDVFILKAFPNMGAEVSFGSGIKRVLIEGYHSCTAPVDAIAKLAEKGDIKYYICSFEPFKTKYDTMVELEKKGVVFLTGALTDIYAKMLLNIL